MSELMKLYKSDRFTFLAILINTDKIEFKRTVRRLKDKIWPHIAFEVKNEAIILDTNKSKFLELNDKQIKRLFYE